MNAIEPISITIRRVRAVLGLTQTDLARRLSDAARDSVVSRHEVSRWERGQRVPGRYWRHWLAVVLGVPGEVLAAAAKAERDGSQATGPAPHSTQVAAKVGELAVMYQRVAAKVAELAAMCERVAVCGDWTYHRDDPDPGAGARQGARYGGLIDSGELIDETGDASR
jgi:transcriptional regulator with XRE-family HTH domain